MAVGHLWQGERDRKREISDLMQISKHGNGTLRSIEGRIQICRNKHDSGTLAVAERERESSVTSCRSVTMAVGHLIWQME